MKYRHIFTYSVFIAFYEKISYSLDNWPRNGKPEEKLVYLSLDNICKRLYKYTYKDTGTVSVTFNEIEMLTIIAALPKISTITGHYESNGILNLVQEIDKRILIY
jgi:hypothetical protein